MYSKQNIDTANEGLLLELVQMGPVKVIKRAAQ
jgi:hypothetical protein